MVTLTHRAHVTKDQSGWGFTVKQGATTIHDIAAYKASTSSFTMDIVLVTLSSTAVETAIAQCTSRWAMARGHRLNTSIVLVAVHGLSGLFGRFSWSSLSLSRPLPTLSPSLIGHLASVDVKQHESKLHNGGGSSHPCRWIASGGESDHTCHKPNRFSELAKKKKKKKRKKGVKH